MAAAGILALEQGPGRLHEDHARARRLAEGVEETLPGTVDLEQVETNMVFVDTEAVGLPLLDTLEQRGWVRRTPNPDDRRSLLIEITAAAAIMVVFLS